MSHWPNWIDLIIVTILLRTCYNGFGRGLLAELFNLLGVVCITVLTVNYAGLVTGWIRSWLRWDPAFTTFLIFWLFFLIVLAAMRMVMKFLAAAVKWERLHWAIQGIGLILGGLRGLWWSGFILLAFATSGFGYLHDSLEQSVLGPRLLFVYHHALIAVADRCPGVKFRSDTIIPPAKPQAAKPAAG